MKLHKFYILQNQASVDTVLYTFHKGLTFYIAPIGRPTTDSNQFAKLADIVLNLEKF